MADQEPGITPDEALRSMSEGSNKRLGVEDVDRAKAEKAEKATRLMDDMEASVAAQGQYFVKVGEKTPITEERSKSAGLFGRRTETYDETVGYQDGRALMLKAPAKVDLYGVPTENFVFATPDGLKIVKFYSSELQNPQTRNAELSKRRYDFLSSMAKGEDTPGQHARLAPKGYGTEIVFTGDSEDSIKAVFDLTEPDPSIDISNMFGEAVSQSIAMTESPHKANVERAAAQTQTLESADNIINNLPARA